MCLSSENKLVRNVGLLSAPKQTTKFLEVFDFRLGTFVALNGCQMPYNNQAKPK